MVASKPKPSSNKKKSSKLGKTKKPAAIKGNKSNQPKTSNETDESYKTVCCCLCADEPTRQFLWEAMERYSLLVNLLLEQVGHSPKFEQWKQQGWVSKDEVIKLCNALKQQEQFKGLPGRFYTSAQSMVKDTFEGWVKLQRQLVRRINGKKRWLRLVEEDLERAKITDFSPEMIQNRAKEILSELSQQGDIKVQLLEGEANVAEERQGDDNSVSQRSVFSLLFDLYEMTEDALTRHAIVHLLKNEGEVNEEPEDLEKLAQKLAAKREAIQLLEEQLTSRLPKGRDPTGEQAIEFLQEAIQLPKHSSCYPALFLFDVFYHYVLLPMPSIQYGFYLLRMILTEAQTVESEFLAWQETMTERLQNAARISNSLPYPVIFGSTDDLHWSFESRGKKQQDSQSEQLQGCQARKRPPKRKRNKLKTRSEERICVSFNGFHEHVFKVYCDRRQLPIFRLFATDWQNYKKLDEEKKYSLGLFALREAKLIWKEDKQSFRKKEKSKKANSEKLDVLAEQKAVPPWETHRLYLHCSIDPNLLTAEGTEKVRQRKLVSTKKNLDNSRKKEQELVSKISRDDLTHQEKQEFEKELIDRQRNTLKYQTSLSRLNNLPPRPSKTPYQGEPNITLGISFDLKEIIGVAVVNLQTQNILEYYSVRKLLTNQHVKKLRRKRSLLQLKLEQYRFVNRLRKLSRRNVVRRQKEQKQGQCIESKAESNLGQYLERLIAARIAQVALQWRASSVVIPDLGDMSEYIESSVKARAKQLFPKHREQQKNYTKQFCIKTHRWSYKKLGKFICSRLSSEGISIKTGRQPTKGNPANKALRTALSAYSLA